MPLSLRGAPLNLLLAAVAVAGVSAGRALEVTRDPLSGWKSRVAFTRSVGNRREDITAESDENNSYREDQILFNKYV